MTEGNTDQTQAGSKVKTFPVPFAVGEIKTNTTIKTNTPSKPSKEQIINQALKFHSQGNISEAKKYYEYFINQGLKDHTVFSNYGLILKNLENLKKAELYTRKAIEIKPDFAIAYSNLGHILSALGKFKDAEISTRKAIEIKPDYSNAHFNLGNILKNLGKLKEAEIAYLKAIEHKPNYSDAHNNLGNILKDLGKVKEAEIAYLKAIEHKPNNSKAHNNLGNILRDCGKLEEAKIAYLKAIELNPNFTKAYSNLGNILKDLGNLKDAEMFTRKAIEIKPDYSNAHFNLGIILKDLGNFEEAINHLKHAIKLDNQLSKAKAALIETKGNICDWSDQVIQTNWLKNLGIEGSSVSPFGLLYYDDNPLRHLKRSKKLYKEQFTRPSTQIKSPKKNIIHIGYFSADFRAHPVMYVIKRILELHDSSKFKVYIYSFKMEEDEYTQRLKKEPFNFRSIYGKSDLEAVEIARNDNLDIAVDLMGHTNNNRMSIFSYRVSPVQICYLCPTTGSSEIDYLIGDKVLIPNEFQKYYSEKILYIPNSFMCFDDTKKTSNKYFTRKEFNLPDDAFVMAVFHRSCKITIKEIESWSRILNHISNSILWISDTNKIAKDNILKALKKRGVNIDNILFAPRMKSYGEHLSRHSCADLFLDTFNFNANSTAIDALWVGLPIITLLGKSYTSRTSASFLTTLGLTELIAHTPKEYEDIIISLAKEPNKLRELKNKLLNSKYKNPLFNSKLFTENLERIYCNLVDN